MKYEWFIGLRYLRSKRRQKFISVIGAISVLGVLLGVMALNIVLSVMGGFEDELKDKLLGVNSHIVVLSSEGGIADYEAVTERVLKVPHVVGASPFIYGQAMVVGESSVTGAIVRGIDVARAGGVTNIEAAVGRAMLPRPRRGERLRGERLRAELVKRGREVLGRLLHPTKRGLRPVVIGKELAAAVGVTVGDTINLVSPFGRVGPFGLQPRIRRFEVVGLCDYGMYEYDSALVYVSLEEAMSFYDMDGKASGIEVKVDDVYRVRDIGTAIEAALGYPFYTRNWQDVNRSLFRALRLERMAIGIFLGFIIVVAALDIVSTLTMVVMEKSKDIAILRAMGATRGGIMKVFVIDGMIIGLAGTALGTVLGFLVLWLIKTNEFVKGLIPFDPTVYPISEFPVKLEPLYFVTVAAVTLLICLVATLYPSFQASRKDPVEALRYE